NSAIDDLSKIGRGQPDFQGAREIKETADQRITAVDLGGDVAGNFPRDLVLAIDVALEHFGGRLDGAQGVGQFVGGTGGQLSEGGEAFASAYGGFRLA